MSQWQWKRPPWGKSRLRGQDKNPLIQRTGPKRPANNSLQGWDPSTRDLSRTLVSEPTPNSEARTPQNPTPTNSLLPVPGRNRSVHTSFSSLPPRKCPNISLNFPILSLLTSIQVSSFWLIILTLFLQDYPFSFSLPSCTMVEQFESTFDASGLPYLPPSILHAQYVCLSSLCCIWSSPPVVVPTFQVHTSILPFLLSCFLWKCLPLLLLCLGSKVA